MYRFPRALSLLVLPIVPVLVGASPTAAQQGAVPAAPPPAAVDMSRVDTSPWLFKGSDIPPDPEWHFGRLPNGLRYAVRKNGVPPGQVAVRVRIDAGSLNEEDAQQGYAHLIEHLSFRGSRYVPDGEAKRVWQRFGATFGSDSNASTTPTQTVYKLDLPSATDARLDESLKIFSGMMASPTITQANLDSERPAVLAEQREAPGAQVRVSDKLRETFFAGQPLADRSPIGTLKTLQAATPAAVAAFHDRWYRPERAVVIVSGDLDPAVLAKLVVKNFGEWKGVGPSPADPDFGKPDPKAPETATLAEPSLPNVIATAVLRPWTYRDDTVIFNQKRLVDLLAVRLINRRLETRARGGGSFLQASVSLDDVSRSANGTFTNIVPIGEDWAGALKDVRAVIEDAAKTPATTAEVARELAEFDAAMKTQVETARVEMGANQADDMVSALDIRETVAGPQTSYSILQSAEKAGMFTPAALLESTQRIFKGDASRAVVNTKTADATASAKLADALKADVSKLAGKRSRQAAVSFAKLPKLGVPGKVTAREPIADLGMEKVTFANGVRMLVFPSTAETGRVYLHVRFGRGYNALPGDRATPAWAGDLALAAGGIGKLNQGDLDALTTGRQMGLDFGIDDDAFTIGAISSPADYADNLKLMAAKIAFPAWDPAPVTRARAVMLAGYAGFGASPDAVLSRDLDRLLHDGDPRWGVPDRAGVEALTPAAFKAFWAPILAAGPIEVDVFGDATAAAAIDAVGKTFGALKPRGADAAPAPAVRFPAHVATPVMRTHSGAETQAAAVIAWPTGGGPDSAEQRRLDVLAAIFSDRLFDRLRSAAGASYSPSVGSQWPDGLASGGRLLAVGQVAPDKVGLFFQLSRQIAAELVAKPVDTDEFQRTIQPMIQYIIRASSGNQFWLQQASGGAFDQARIDNTRKLAQDLKGITPADIQATAAKYLRPEKDWTMAVVPEKATSSVAPAKAGASQ